MSILDFFSKEEYVVWKYKIPFGANNKVSVPLGSVLLSVGAQGSDVVAWYVVNPKLEKEQREHTFSVFATGERFKGVLGRLKFAGTVQFEFQGYIYHVFTDAPLSKAEF